MISKNSLIRIVRYAYKPLIAVTVCSIFVYIFGSRISGITEHIREVRTAEAILEKRVEAIGAIQKDFATLGTDYDRVINTLPTTDDVPDISAALNNLAASNGMKLNRTFGSLIPTDLPIKEPGTAIATIDVDLALTGTSSQFVRFLKALENFRYFVSVNSITISADIQQGWNTSSTIHIRGKIFLKQPISS